jgi:hypothetical protein
MAKKSFKPEQIIQKLREVNQSKGMSIAECIRQIGVT